MRIKRRRYDPLAGCPLDETDFNRLATYNGERGRGIAHTAEYDAEMEPLQRRYDLWLRAEAAARNAQYR